MLFERPHNGRKVNHWVERRVQAIAWPSAMMSMKMMINTEWRGLCVLCFVSLDVALEGCPTDQSGARYRPFHNQNGLRLDMSLIRIGMYPIEK